MKEYRFLKLLTTVCVIKAQTLVTTSKSKIELDSHAEKCIVEDKFKSYMIIIGQLMSTDTTQMMTISVLKQLMLQHAMTIHIVDSYTS